MTQQITIRLTGDITENVRAVVRGDWALHHSNYGDYTLTYVPTGQGIWPVFGRPVRLARVLRALAAVGPCPLPPEALLPPHDPRSHLEYRSWVERVTEATGPVRGHASRKVTHW